MASASHASATATLGTNNGPLTIRHRGQPVMLINSDPTYRKIDTAADIFLHELIHVKQQEDHPIISAHPDGVIAHESLSAEEEAYFYQNAALQAAQDAGLPVDKITFDYVKTIETARQSHNDAADPWRSSRALAQDLFRRNLPISPELVQMTAFNPTEQAASWHYFNPPASYPAFQQIFNT